MRLNRTNTQKHLPRMMLSIMSLLLVLSRGTLANEKDSTKLNPDAPAFEPPARFPVFNPPDVFFPMVYELGLGPEKVQPALFDDDSHSVCRRTASIFASKNKFWCGLNNAMKVPYSADARAIWSIEAKPCENQAVCHAKFKCVIRSSFKGCPKEILQHGLKDRWIKMFCLGDKRPFYPRKESSESHVNCLEPKLLRKTEIRSEETRKQDKTRAATEEVISTMLVDTGLGEITCRDVVQAGRRVTSKP